MTRQKRLLRYALVCTALIVAYAVVPVQDEPQTGNLIVRWSITAAMLALLVAAIGRQALRQLRRPDAPLGGMILGIIGGLLVFALIDYSLAVHWPGQFNGLETRVDAVYFATSTLLTVGFGDIVPQGQVARAVVCAQMIFNVSALATSASLVTRRLAARARSRGDRRTAAPPDSAT